MIRKEYVGGLRWFLRIQRNTQKLIPDTMDNWWEKHSIYANQIKTIPVKRHKTIDRITANEICKQAGLKQKF